MRTKIAAMLAGSSLLALVSPALAQTTQPAPEEESGDEIVVTGTFIRGIAPTGNQVLGVTEEDVQASGAMSTNEVLAGIPQLSSMFNTVNTVGVTGGGGTGTINQNTTIQVQRPVLRNIGTNTAGSSPTLVLMDGHRMVGAGVNQSSPDAGVIPPALLQRVEIVTDGGTALYGTDAVGGVLNFITRDSFDGVRVTGRYGFGEDVSRYDASITAGTDWGSGSVFGSVSYNESDPVLGIDRSWYSGVNWNPNAPFSRYLTGELRMCEDPNVVIGSTNYAVSAPSTIGAANSYNACDVTDYQTISADQSSISYFAGLSQELTDGIELNVRAFYTNRETMNGRGAQTATVRVDDAVPNTNTPGQSVYYVNAPGAAGSIQSVLFNYAPVNGNGFAAAFNETGLETWGITPTLTVDLPGDWQLSAIANYGESDTFFRNHEVNSDRQQYYATGNNGNVPVGASAPLYTYNTTAGATGNNINPYNIGASNPAILADILDWQRYGWAHQTLTNYRAVFDGPLLTLPGGQIRGAFGAEYIQEQVERRAGFTRLNDEGSLLKPSIDREVTAFFGELNIPIIGEGNRLPLVEAFTLSVSARRDEYSDFGETTNPQVGAVWEVTDWFALRANWGQSFNAPAAVEVLDQNFPTVQLNNTIFNWGNNIAIPGLAPGQAGTPHTNLAGGAPVGSLCTAGTYAGQSVCTAGPTAAAFRSLAIAGASPDLQPQTGETWSLGFDAHAPFLPSLRLSATYYNIRFDNTLGSIQNVVFNTTQNVYNFWNTRLFINGTDGSGPGGVFTASDITTFCSQALNPTDCASGAANPDSIYFIADLRQDNFGSSLQEGVDVSLRYSHDFDWGTWDAALNGNYRINSENRAAGATTFVRGDLDAGSRYNVSVNTGVTVGDFYARATVNYSAGYNLNHVVNPTATSAGPFQIGVDPFVVTDLFFRYDLGELAVADNLQLTLNVDNVFDEDPPQLRTTGQVGHANGQSLGRVFTIGLSADF